MLARCQAPLPPSRPACHAAAKAVSAEVRRKIEERQRAAEAAAAAGPLTATQIARLQYQAAQVLHPGETVAAGLKRLGGHSRRPAKRSRQRGRGSEEPADMSADAPPDPEAKEQFNRLTEAAMKLMDAGENDVYTQTKARAREGGGGRAGRRGARRWRCSSRSGSRWRHASRNVPAESCASMRHGQPSSSALAPGPASGSFAGAAPSSPRLPYRRLPNAHGGGLKAGCCSSKARWTAARACWPKQAPSPALSVPCRSTLSGRRPCISMWRARGPQPAASWLAGRQRRPTRMRVRRLDGLPCRQPAGQQEHALTGAP